MYGRYLACVTPVLFMAGVAVLASAARRTVLWAAGAAAMLAVVAACVVQWYAGDLLTQYTFTAYDFPETAFLTWDWTAFRLWHATLTGLVLLGVSVAAVRLRRHGPLVLAACWPWSRSACAPPRPTGSRSRSCGPRPRTPTSGTAST